LGGGSGEIALGNEPLSKNKKMRFSACLLVLACGCSGTASASLTLTGTAINNSDPEKPIAAPMQITFEGKVCTLTISPPLIGSGACQIKSFDKASGKIEIVSAGVVGITWSGTVKGNLASGSYKVSAGEQTGSFYLAIMKEPNVAAQAKASSAVGLSVRSGSCVPAVESAISGDIHGWDGETIFKLDNGQIWQQAEYDYTYFYDFHPDVTIYQTSAGCRMKVEDEEETILVKRLK
jgi:hypothetical protein